MIRLLRLVGDVPRLELFARRRVAGWDAWGHGVTGSLALSEFEAAACAG